MKYHQCCIDNMPRTFVDFAQTALSRGEDGCLSVNLYSDAKGVCGDDAVEISGGYPFGDVVTVRVSAAGRGAVRFRRPSWFDAMSVNGTEAAGDWFAASLEKGENLFRLAFARSARIVDARPCVDGVWTATFAKGGERFSVRVCDFASAADSDDPANLFSIWF